MACSVHIEVGAFSSVEAADLAGNSWRASESTMTMANGYVACSDELQRSLSTAICCVIGSGIASMRSDVDRNSGKCEFRLNA